MKEKINFIATTIFILVTITCSGQFSTYKNLVFAGAGIKGIAYAGVLEEFEKVQLLDNIKKVGGTSAGAIIALTISLGYNAKEIKDIIYNTQLNRFNDGGVPFFGGLHRLKKYYGWFRGDKFTRWLGGLISKKTNNSEITFLELHNRGYKDLYVTVTCLNKQKLIVLSHETYPNMKIKDAVRISSSIPLYFKAVFIDNTGTIIKKSAHRTDLDIMVDGGIIGNYPIDLFDSIVPGSLIKTRKVNAETIGIRIDSEEQIQYDQISKELTPQKIGNIKDYMQAFYIFVLQNLNRNKLIPEDWQRSITISSVHIGSRIKKLSADQKDSLIISGRKSAIEFLSKTTYKKL